MYKKGRPRFGRLLARTGWLLLRSGSRFSFILSRMAFHVGVRMASNIFFLFPLFPCYVLWAHHLYWNMPTFAISLVILSHSLSARFDLMPGRAGDGRLDGFCWYEHIVIRVPLLTHTHTHSRTHIRTLPVWVPAPTHVLEKAEIRNPPQVKTGEVPLVWPRFGHGPYQGGCSSAL